MQDCIVSFKLPFGIMYGNLPSLSELYICFLSWCICITKCTHYFEQVNDNGIRSPLLVRRKGSFPAGVTADTQLAIVEDIFPTMMDLAGAGLGGKPIDGMSLASVLYNPEEDYGFSQRSAAVVIIEPPADEFYMSVNTAECLFGDVTVSIYCCSGLCTILK